MALITPALSHREVVVQAIAARDRSRAEEFAKKHGVPDVKNNYQGMSGLFRESSLLVHFILILLVL